MAKKRKKRAGKSDGEQQIYRMLRRHFAPVPLDEITISERKFPFRVRADLQRAIDKLFSADTKILYFGGIHKEYAHEGFDFPGLTVEDSQPAVAAPPQYEEVHIGEDEPVRCLKNGLWLLREGKTPYAVLVVPATNYGRTEGMRFQVATLNNPGGTQIVQRFFKHLEESVLKADSYRGKILSLEEKDPYSGRASAILVHRLKAVERDQVILPKATLDLLDRNVIQFVRRRPQLAAVRQPTKKGVLFYGPPGTGKTHTIHYLAASLPGHTTLIISAEQVGQLSEYMTLARLLQPSLVVIEDVDLIGRDREHMDTCEEVVLNKLLNEMDGLQQDADILFLLTTNRPETLEAALASRPGRVDQAIEFPLPDDEGRGKLLRLYAGGAEVPEDVAADIVQRTQGVSAAFIKELMRRAIQFHLEHSDSTAIEPRDVKDALDEMLFRGGSLNRKLLGGSIQPGEAGER